MNRSHRTVLVAGLALIALTNVLVLGGAAYNRGGEPDSLLRLTQRELRPPYPWVARRESRENSGLEMQLRWRVLTDAATGAPAFRLAGENGGVPAWLDAPKMASLGFDTKLSTENVDGSSRYQRQLPRDALVVLELDGPARQEALRRTIDAAKEVEARNERGHGQDDAQALVDHESRLGSRLFAVDVGLDREALRARFPDRAKYAIVHGRVRPAWAQESKTASGVIEALAGASLNVPLQMRSAFDGVVPANYGRPNEEGKRFEASVAFGRRLEPWLVSAATP